jgi:hypothetical protein
MNIFEKLIHELGWSAANLHIPDAELREVLAMPEDRALSYAIAFMQRLYISLLPYKEQGDEGSKWAGYWWDKHRRCRNALVSLTKEFDSDCYDKWCLTHWHPNEFKVQR